MKWSSSYLWEARGRTFPLKGTADAEVSTFIAVVFNHISIVVGTVVCIEGCLAFTHQMPAALPPPNWNNQKISPKISGVFSSLESLLNQESHLFVVGIFHLFWRNFQTLFLLLVLNPILTLLLGLKLKAWLIFVLDPVCFLYALLYVYSCTHLCFSLDIFFWPTF